MNDTPSNTPPPGALAAFLARRDVRCKKCKYNLRGLTADTCPECGTRYMLAGGTLASEVDAFTAPRSLACPACGYDRTGLIGTICPECGYDSTTSLPAPGQPADAPWPPLYPVQVVTWIRVAKSVAQWLALLGHVLGLAVAVFSVFGWIDVLGTVSISRRQLLSQVACGAVPIVSFLFALMRRRQQNRERRNQPAQLALEVALGWLWLLVLMLVWRWV